MITFKQKFAYTLQNAQRYLAALKQTQRQRIQEVQDEQSQMAPKDNTFESQEYPQLPYDVSKPKTVADQLQFNFLKTTYIEYCKDLQQLERNELNLLNAIQKIVQKLNYIKDANEIVTKLIRSNQQLDAEIIEYQQQERDLDLLLLKEHFSELKLLEVTKKNIRSILRLEIDENEVYVGFANKWHSYLEEIHTPIKLSYNQYQNISKSIEEDAKKVFNEQDTSIPKLQKNVSNNEKAKKRLGDDLLGNLKQFSKNLKLPIEKKK